MNRIQSYIEASQVEDLDTFFGQAASTNPTSQDHKNITDYLIYIKRNQVVKTFRKLKFQPKIDDLTNDNFTRVFLHIQLNNATIVEESYNLNETMIIFPNKKATTKNSIEYILRNGDEATIAEFIIKFKDDLLKIVDTLDDVISFDDIDEKD